MCACISSYRPRTRYRIRTPHTHTRLRPQKKKTKRPEKFEPVIDKPAELLLCFYSRVTWWRETLWLEGRKTFTITWHIVSIPSKHNDFVALLFFFFSFPRYFFNEQSLSEQSLLDIRKIFIRNYWTIVGGKIQRCWVTLLFPSLPHPFLHDPCCSSFPFI